MERFLKSKKCNIVGELADKFSKNTPPSDSSGRSNGTEESTTLSIDMALSRQDSQNINDLRKSQVAAWNGVRHSKEFQHWGVRHKPKTVIFNELKLQGSSCKLESLGNIKLSKRRNTCMKGNDKSDSISLPNEIEEDHANNNSQEDNDGTTLTSIQLSRRTTKLLQFDKSHRPAYYGSWSKESGVVGPRRPFAKDSVLDYDVDSDEEWEEEEPGESLSDCDKDEEILEEDPKADDDDESEDSFFVPDGYLSENEGVQDDSILSDAMSSEARSSPTGSPEIENEECNALVQQQKHLDHLTQQALRKNQPLIITNLLHEKSEIAMAKDLGGTLKVEQICLQALCLVACSGFSIIEQPFDNQSSEGSDICQSQKISTTPTIAAPTISDPNLQEYVLCIQSNPYGMAKVLELLQQKFPSFPKSQLRNKVKDISEFVNNRWQIKREVLEKLGMSVSPDKGRQHKGISSFFSKRCLPPTGEMIDLSESSPQARLKEPAPVINQDAHHDLQENLKIHIA